MTTEYWRWTESAVRMSDRDWREAETITAGIDVGSVSSQAVVMLDSDILCYSNMRTGSNSPESARNVLARALETVKDTGFTEDKIQYAIGTGYGRVNVPMAQRAITEIACHARGANYFCGPKIRTILDMGGQDCKAIHVDEKGKVTNFLMNDKCAAGTGRGMEVFADLLSVPITDVGRMSFEVEEEPPMVSSTCVVFAKSEALMLLRSGWSKEKVLAAYCSAMAHRVVNLLERIGIEPEFTITGGIAKNKGVAKRLLKELGITAIPIEPDSQIAGAVGAALFGRDILLKARAKKAA